MNVSKYVLNPGNRWYAKREGGDLEQVEQVARGCGREVSKYPNISHHGQAGDGWQGHHLGWEEEQDAIIKPLLYTKKI